MKETLADIPQTAMEVFEMLPEGTRCEVIDNALYMSPSPTTEHQRLLLKIASKIELFLEDNKLGEVFIAPCDVYLDNQTVVVQPDIIFISSARSMITESKGIIGSPDFVVELLSNNLKHDQVTKLDVYQRNLIPEYFIVDPKNKQVQHYILVSDQYVLKPPAPGELNIQQLNLTVNF